MSYKVQLFHIQTMRNFEISDSEDFFDHKENFEQFSPQQFQDLSLRLIHYDYEITQEDDKNIYFRNSDDESSATGYLTLHGLYFSSSSNPDDIFEISMTASEFTDTGDFAKFDPQVGEWEV